MGICKGKFNIFIKKGAFLLNGSFFYAFQSIYYMAWKRFFCGERNILIGYFRIIFLTTSYEEDTFCIHCIRTIDVRTDILRPDL